MLQENLLSLSEAAAIVPKGTTHTTVWRWCTSGINGVRLEHIRVGKRMMTSREAMARFFVALATAANTRTEAESAREAVAV